MGERSLIVQPRCVRSLANGLRPFQAEALKAILGLTARIVFVEAPVGAGKSWVVRELFTSLGERPLVLTYPTRILVQAQIGALRNGLPGLTILPWDGWSGGKSVMVEYTGGTLLKLAREEKLDAFPDRSALLNSLFTRLGNLTREARIVITPDVLHLMVTQEFYNKSRHLQRDLKGGVFVFDEFHLYYDLGHFCRLVYNLLDRLEGTVVLLSATPLWNERLRQLTTEWTTEHITFESSEAVMTESATTFNHSLELFIHEGFNTSDREKETDFLAGVLVSSSKPAAVILDSLFRLRHILFRLKPRLEAAGFQVFEWTGERKDCENLDERTILVGTSAIEVGIDRDFRTLVMEASAWASAVQRMGRVGRKNPGAVHLLTRKRFGRLLDGLCEIERSFFEQKILKEVFSYSEPGEERLAASSSGEMFRGDSFPFALYDEDRQEVYFGDESLFSRYDITDKGDPEWRCLSINEKQSELCEHSRIPKGWRDEILLRDRVFPLWGVLRGRLANAWHKVEVQQNRSEGKLTIIADQVYVYYRK
jgi:CRISPR-associated helicase Cas3